MSEYFLIFCLHKICIRMFRPLVHTTETLNYNIGEIENRERAFFHICSILRT